MADSATSIEAFEHQLLRAWVAGDTKTMRKHLDRRFRLVVAAARPVLLDRKSVIEAVGDRWTLSSARFGHVYAREAAGIAIFAAELEMDGRIEGESCSGQWWMVDVWRGKGVFTRWRLLDRQLSRLDGEAKLAQAVKSLQLWR